MPKPNLSPRGVDDRRLVLLHIRDLQPNPKNARTHSRQQIEEIARSIDQFGFNNPILVDSNNLILAGHGRVEAAKLLGLVRIPALRIEHLSAAEKRAYVLADNKLAEKAGWDKEILAIELQELINLDFDVEPTGFSAGEIDALLGSSFGLEEDADEICSEYESSLIVTKPGDCWRAVNNFELGQHGRTRTNVWEYTAGSVNAASAEGYHPTPKPVGLIADAIQDCSRRGDVILDPFCGSGTILLAAEGTGRAARAIEIDPFYCDLAIRRWQTRTGQSAVHVDSGASFTDRENEILHQKDSEARRERKEQRRR